MTRGDLTSERGILDTSVVAAETAVPVAGVLAISVVTLAELGFGVLVAQDVEARAERLRRYSILRGRFDPLPVDDAVAESYARLAATVVEVGRQPRRRSMDLLIAATAHAHGARLFTRNAEDFAGLGDLVEVVPV